MKRQLFLICLLLLITIKVDALSADLDCEDKDYKINNTFSCNLTIEPDTDEYITTFNANISYPNTDLSLLSMNITSPWNNSSSTNLSLSNPDYVANVCEEEPCEVDPVGLNSSLMIATLNFKVKDTTTYGNKTISISGDSLSNSISDEISIISTNNKLKTLTVSGKNFTFNPNTKTYNITGVTTSTVIIAATLEDSRAHFDPNHEPGVKSLNYGTNIIQIIAIAESGESNIYTLNITRNDVRSNNNFLSSLSTTEGSLAPDFSKSTLVYDTTVKESVSSIDIKATLDSNKANFVYGYEPRTVSLNTGLNSILIQVKAENGETRTYTINVTRSDKSSNNYLKSLQISTGDIEFKKAIYDYKLNVLYEIEEFTIVAKAEDSNSSVDIDGNKKLSVGENKFLIKVKAENDSERTYTIIVNRLEEGKQLSTNNYLKGLVVKGYKLNFDKDVLTYTINIKNENQLTMSYQVEDEASIVKVIGNSKLKDKSKIDIVVKSEDGNSRTYTLNIKKNINWSLILLITLGIIVTGSIALLIVFKDKLFKHKEKTIKSDVLQGKKLVLGQQKKESEDIEKTKVFDRKPELTVIPDIPEEVVEEIALYENGKEKKKK